MRLTLCTEHFALHRPTLPPPPPSAPSVFFYRPPPLRVQAEENRGALGWELSGAEQLELEAAAAKVPKKATQNIFQTS